MFLKLSKREKVAVHTESEANKLPNHLEILIKIARENLCSNLRFIIDFPHPTCYCLANHFTSQVDSRP